MLIEREEQQQMEELSFAELTAMPEADRRVYVIFILVSFAFFVNTSYFSLWVMEGLSGLNETSYKQFNKTLFISAIFFLASSFILFVVAHTYIGCKLKEGQINGRNLKNLIKPFLIGYGLLMLAVFVHWKSQWQYMVIPIIPFGFHYVVVSVYTDQIA
jgi:hypothetical protein